MSDAARATESGSVLSPWAPLRIGAFRALWFAQLGSMLGTWMQTVGAQWILVETPDSTALVALVQVATTLPMLLFALPAGALADIMDRRRLLIGVQLFQVAVAGALSVLTAADLMPPVAAADVHLPARGVPGRDPAGLPGPSCRSWCRATRSARSPRSAGWR